jgi:hypothetical protein
MYLVTLEDEDGFWWDDPTPFHTERDARAFVAKSERPPKDYAYVLYSCRELSITNDE